MGFNQDYQQYAKSIIGERLKSERLKRNLKQSELADDISQTYHIQMNQSMISRYEIGVDRFSLEYLFILADYFDIDLNAIGESVGTLHKKM